MFRNMCLMMLAAVMVAGAWSNDAIVRAVQAPTTATTVMAVVDAVKIAPQRATM